MNLPFAALILIVVIITLRVVFTRENYIRALMMRTFRLEMPDACLTISIHATQVQWKTATVALFQQPVFR